MLIDGIAAANDLGLTDAVPAHIVVHTDARLKPFELGNLVIDFRKAAPSKLYWAGRPCASCRRCIGQQHAAMSAGLDSPECRLCAVRLVDPALRSVSLLLL